MPETSQSALADFTRCPRQYYYAHILKARPLVPSLKMEIGSVVHALLARFYRHWKKDGIRPLLDDGYAELAFGFQSMLDREQREQCLDVFNYYYEHRARFDLFDSIESIEEPVVYKIGKYKIRCTFDLTGVQDGQHTLFDHKTVGDVNEAVAFLPLDFQLQLYSLAYQQKYGIIPRLVYNMLRREVPPGYGHRSELTPTGRVSKASRVVTDYLRRPEPFTYSQRELDGFARDLLGVLRAVESTKRAKYYSRSREKSGAMACGHCAYYSPCCAELAGEEISLEWLSTFYTIGEAKPTPPTTMSVIAAGIGGV